MPSYHTDHNRQMVQRFALAVVVLQAVDMLEWKMLIAELDMVVLVVPGVARLVVVDTAERVVHRYSCFVQVMVLSLVWVQLE